MVEDWLLKSDEQVLREKERRFYARVGHCILRFQEVEDYLEELFAAVLRGRRDRAYAIFASVRGIDNKIQIIKAAATGLRGKRGDRLASLLRTVKEVSNVRGKIAHARPVQHGPTRRIKVQTSKGRTVEIQTREPFEAGNWQLHKVATEQTTIIFTVDDLRREYNRINELFLDMIAFVSELSPDD
jgi:hypothetical protein